MIGSDVIQVLVVCSDRPTQSLFAEKLYEALPPDGNLRLTLHVDSSEVKATHNRSTLEAGMNLSKRCPPEAWPEGYWDKVNRLVNAPRATIAIQDASMNAHEFEAVIRAYIRQGYRVFPIFLYLKDEGDTWKIPAHTEFFRGYRILEGSNPSEGSNQPVDWLDNNAGLAAYYLMNVLYKQQDMYNHG